MVFELFAREILYIIVVSLCGSSFVALLVECGQMGFSVSVSGFLSRSIDRFQAPTKAFLHKCIQSVYSCLYVMLIVGGCYQYLVYKKDEYLKAMHVVNLRYYNYLWDFSYSVFINLLLLLISIAVVDWCITKYRYSRSLMMTNDEIRRDQKEEEGDPFVKAKRKALHRSILNQDLISRVRMAKVVIVD